MEGEILSKLYDMGVLNSQAKFSDVDNRLTVASFCRRRLAVIMITSKMAQTVSAVSPDLVSANQISFEFLVQAVKFIEQGHVRVGPENITDPAYLVTRCVSH